MGRREPNDRRHLGYWCLSDQFWLLVATGFLAQLVDGALGMAFGVISTSCLLTIGINPAAASAAVHAAEVATTGASGISHILHRNVDWKLFRRLAVAGMLGAAAGAWLLTFMSESQLGAQIVAPLISVYLMFMGFVIIAKALSKKQEVPPRLEGAIPLGAAGGFLDAMGGGGWGPVTASTLLGRGHTPRMVLGSVNTAEFFVTIAASVTFLFSGAFGDLWVVSGLIVGGVIAAPFGGFLARLAPAKLVMWMVGLLVIALSSWRLWAEFDEAVHVLIARSLALFGGGP